MIGNSKEYEELETRARKFRRYERMFNFLANYWVVVFVFLPLGDSIVFYFFGRKAETWEQMAFLFVGGFILLGVVYKIGTTMNKYRLEDNEWAIFYTYSILDNLVKYSETKNVGMKTDYRKKAFKSAKAFLFCIKKRWKIGRFKLVEDYFGKPLSELKKNIEYRIIPQLKCGNDEELGKIEQIMRNFLSVSKNLKIEDIITLNGQMSSRLLSTEPVKMGLLRRIWNYFGVHKILRHGLVVSAFAIGCCVFYYMIVTYVEISKEVVFGSTIVLFVGLITIYFRRHPKE